MKKLMILGGNPETGILVKKANAMGVYTIVVDLSPGSPAKKLAAESYDIDVFEVDKVAGVAKKLGVDGVMVGVADILVKPYREICEKLDLPCYVSKEAVAAFCSKDGFKRYCAEYHIQDIPGIYLNKGSVIEKPDGLDYPLMIKPVDSGGGVGMKICWDDADFKESVKTALDFSRKGVVLIEKYMECDDMAVYYTFQNGVPHISALSDRFTSKKQGDASPVCIGAIFPSKYSDLFVQQVHPKLCELFKALNIENGILNIQFFVKDNVIYAYDPGFRLQGEAPDIPIAHINGFDHRKMLVRYAFTGVFGDDDLANKNDFRFKGKIACTIWVLLTDGQIGSINGMDKIRADENVIFALERFQEGDIIPEEWLGTEKQVYARIYTVSASIKELNSKIRAFQEYLQIQDIHGASMILEWLKPFDEDYYNLK